MKLAAIALLIVAVASFSIASASNTTTTFQTGPFTVSVDLGVPCSDINISKPVQDESLTSGEQITNYSVRACSVFFLLKHYEKKVFDRNTQSEMAQAGLEGIMKDLVSMGADRTISSGVRDINGMPGAVCWAYTPKYGSYLYSARFYISSKSTGVIFYYGNENVMKNILRSLNVKESLI